MLAMTALQPAMLCSGVQAMHVRSDAAHSAVHDVQCAGLRDELMLAMSAASHSRPIGLACEVIKTQLHDRAQEWFRT